MQATTKMVILAKFRQIHQTGKSAKIMQMIRPVWWSFAKFVKSAKIM